MKKLFFIYIMVSTLCVSCDQSSCWECTNNQGIVVYETCDDEDAEIWEAQGVGWNCRPI